MADYKKTIDFIKSVYGNQEFTPLAVPVFIGNEKKYLNECIDTTQVDFQMEVTATETSTEKSSTEGSSSTNCFGGWSVNVGGKVSSSRENTRSTNQTARYQVDESNRQQRQTEGLSKLMDIMASCVEPLPTKKNDEE